MALWLVAVDQLIPVWSYRYLPTQDGPPHPNNAQNFHDPEVGSSRWVGTGNDEPLVGARI
jgi:hypothetical protein